ncbi:acyltransferase family protein [Streptomyces sp. NPDC048172]|uniref:acyltransferase family protein n=1 Tax=Streptomyces sp. NPDC048172 TaxID=3365505 RepID=UPI003713A070
MHREHPSAPAAPPAPDSPAPASAPSPPYGGEDTGASATVPPPGTAPGSGSARAGGSGSARAGGGQPRARFRRLSGASAPGGRDPFLDNAKFLLVVLVVAGHNWDPLVEGMRGVKAAYLLVYAFHMPAFVMLCGYFSRSFTGRPEQVRRLLAGVLLPYLVFEAVYAGVYALFLDQPFAVTPTEPRFVCWFLAALFVWRLTSPLWRAVRWPVAVTVVLSVGAGLTDLGSELALSRVLMFLPWFVLGLRLRSEHLRPLRNRAARRWALPLMALAAVGAYWAAPRVDRRWVLMEHGSAQLGVEPYVYAGVRLGLFAVSAVLVAAFLALVPSRRTGFTALGAVTVYPFLLHGLLLKPVEGLGGYGPVYDGGLLAVAATTVVAVAWAVLLSSAPVRRALWPLVEPRFPRWLSPDGRADEGTPGGGSPGAPRRPAAKAARRAGKRVRGRAGGPTTQGGTASPVRT